MLNKHAIDHRLIPATGARFTLPALVAVALVSAAAFAPTPAGATDSTTKPGVTAPATGGANAQSSDPASDPAGTLSGTTPNAGTLERAPSSGTATDSTGQSTDARPVEMVGLPVVTSDGERVGDVEKVVANADGEMKEVLVKTGGFLGFGGKRVAIPVDKIATQDKSIRLTMTAKEVGSLPEVPAQSG
ncbi:MAG: PRC-barrel domain-containing protein [Pseudomonadota bacterium]